MTPANISSCPAGSLGRLPAVRLTGGLNPPHRWALILLRRKETITLLSIGSALRSAPAEHSEQKQSPPLPNDCWGVHCKKCFILTCTGVDFSVSMYHSYINFPDLLNPSESLKSHGVKLEFAAV